MLEEVRPTQKNAALTTHISQFCFHENFTRDEEARKGETNDNFRDGVGPLGIIKYQIPSDPPVGQEAPRTLSKVLGRNRDLLNPDSLAWPLYWSLPRLISEWFGEIGVSLSLFSDL